MNKIRVTKRPLPILHPFFLTTYSIVAFLAYNIEEVRVTNALRPLAISLAGSLILYFFLLSIIRNRHRASFITSYLVLLFFTYGHAYEFLESFQINGISLGRHRYLLSVWVLLILFGVWWSRKSWASSSKSTQFLNMITLIALIFPTIRLGGYGIRVLRSNLDHPNNSSLNTTISTNEIDYMPDVYYIILDGYTRDDILKKYYQIDNSQFLNQLIDLGFFVAYCSQSNYAQTQLSLASSLNFNYLNNLGDQFTPKNTSRVGLSDLIQHNSTRENLEFLGYKVIAFDSGYDPTRWKDADMYLSPSIVQDINDFEERFIRTTAARLVTEGISILDLPPDWEKRDQAHRDRILFTLDKLSEIPSISGPKFIFAHIISPHWPHVFGPNGEPVHEHNDSVNGYRNQVLFINQRIIPLIKTIITKSQVPPIIILQGDHGSIIESPERRMSIFNAYYLPGDHQNLLYESISPVNTFRVVFNTYFGASYNILTDTSLYSEYEYPYSFQEINNLRPGCN